MAPHPIAIPRRPLPRTDTAHTHVQRGSPPAGYTTPIFACASLTLLVLTLPWARRWLQSGAAIESLILLCCSVDARIFPSIPLWTILTTLNLTYSICSTSWLLYGIFAMACYPLVAITCIFQFTIVADFVRRNLRKVLRSLHFTRDKIALFNLPAMEIDTDVNGLFVLRGITFSLSNLTIIAHGVELGLKLADEMELAIHTDEVKIQLFRRIDIGDVYVNVKGGKVEMSFGDLEDASPDGASDDDDFLQGDTPLLRAATAGAEGFKDRPKLRESLTGVTYMKDTPASGVLDTVTTLSPDDTHAAKQYHDILTDIRTGSAVYQCRQQVLRGSASAKGFTLDEDDSEKSLRAAVCAALHEIPSVTHPPTRSIRVTTLQNMSRPAVRRFLHRLPLLLRLLLAPLSYFHPLAIASVNAAGSGKWVTSLLQENIFKHYGSKDSEIRRLQRKVSTWLTDANFCMQLAEVDGLGQVSISTWSDIVAHLRFADIMAYRTLPQSGVTEQVVRLGGADATFTIPSFLLPHHEHLLPPEPTPEQEEAQSDAIDKADGMPKTKQAEKDLEQLQKDETNMKIAIHGSLPAWFDQSLLNFVAALVKATKIIEIEKHVDEVADDNTDTESIAPTDGPGTPQGINTPNGGFKMFTKHLRQGLKDASTGDHVKDFARKVNQSTRDGMKKAFVGGVINDRWIAKMVGKVAAKLAEAQGDIGYSGDVPIALAPYRAIAEPLSKLLP